MSGRLSPLGRYQTVAFYAALALMTGLAAYDGYWFTVESLARLGLLPRDALDFDIYAFVATTSLMESLFFVCATLAKTGSVILLLFRRWQALVAWGIAVACHVLDWISLVGNPYYDGSVDGTITMALELIAVLPLFYLHSTGALSRR